MIISVWGNNGSGTSTLALKLALTFSQKKQNVVLVDTNFIAPQAGIWFPKEDFSKHQSLANILDNNIETEIVARKIKMINQYFGYLGYAQDMAINAITSRDDTPIDLLKVLNNLADVVIVDCQPNITQDVLSFMAIDIADVKILNMTPDLRGLAWYNSNVTMMTEKWEAQNARVIKVFNQVHLNSPAEAVESYIGNVEFYLPYYQEITEQMYTGMLGETKYKGRSKKYGAIVTSIYDVIAEYDEKNPTQTVLVEVPESEPDEDEISEEDRDYAMAGNFNYVDEEIVDSDFEEGDN